jgi:TPR repeat protein
MSLGQLYYQGLHSVSRNYPMALQYFQAALNGGNEQAAIQLGYMYLHGEGVEKDVKLAKQLFQLGISQVCFYSFKNIHTCFLSISNAMINFYRLFQVH